MMAPLRLQASTQRAAAVRAVRPAKAARTCHPPSAVWAHCNKLHGVPVCPQRGDKVIVARAASERPASEISSGVPEEARSQNETYQWFSHWYPVHVVDHVDADRPHHIKLLGKDLVLWCDNRGKWNCFQDMCPHRLAPLSEGRIEDDGTLLCAYHAWRFDNSGKCVSLPQAKTPITEWKPNRVPCAASYPVMVSGSGVIFVWPQSGPEAEEAAAATKPRGFDEMLGGDEVLGQGTVMRTKWTVRDLPYGWDYFMENACDPAHVPVSHHNIVGNRYDDPKYFDLVPVKKMTLQDGFHYRTESSYMEDPNSLGSSSVQFQPPCFVRIRSPFVNGMEANVCLYATPVSRGYTRVIVCQVHRLQQPFHFFQSKPVTAARILCSMPRWLNHVFSAKFVHQDLVFLHRQEKIVHQMMESQDIRTPANGYDLPTPSDKMVVLFRQWYHQMAGGGVPWAPGTPAMPPAEQDNSKLFDTYNAHTKHCKSCQGAVKGIDLASALSAVGAAIAFAVGVVTYSAHSAAQVSISAAAGSKAAAAMSLPMLLCPIPWSAAVLFVLSAGLLALRVALLRLKGMFFLVEFSHADNH